MGYEVRDVLGDGKCGWEIMMNICMGWTLVVSDTHIQYSTVHNAQYRGYRNL